MSSLMCEAGVFLLIDSFRFHQEVKDIKQTEKYFAYILVIFILVWDCFIC